MLIYTASSILLGLNWLLYIWAVNTGNIVESSLGYFINPLVSVLFGVTFLKEKLRIWQWLPVSIATCGVIYLTIDFGRLPWIALGLAATFGLYGLMKKISPLNSLFGLTLETAILFVPALTYLLIVDISGNGSFLHQNILTDYLLIAAGVVTAVPLLLFGSAARLIPLSLLGLLQYVAPTCQFLLGVVIYQEPFPTTRLVGFVIIWFALVLFWLEGFHNNRKMKGISNH
jgi:chloramphenicol-sensitive protein RarD